MGLLLRPKALLSRYLRQNRSGGPLPAAVYDHALATGFSRGFEVADVVALLGMVVTVFIRVTKEDTAGIRLPGTG
jgi:hypothetical protein